MELIYLDLEYERPGFIEDPTFNVIPDIEDFFDEENEEAITPALLDGLVRKVKSNQLDKNAALELLKQEDNEGNVLLSHLQLKIQQVVATWDEIGTNQIAHKMSKDFIRWLVQEANKGDWDGRALGEAFCQLDSDNKLKLATVDDEELQKQLAMLNKEKSCLSAPLLGSSLQEWIYQEA